MRGRAIVLGVVLAVSILIVGAVIPVETRPQPANAAEPTFDHSNCQYPDRWSNPANGCDNSDPAVPECIKGFSTKEAEDACIAAFVAQNTPQPAIVETPAPAVTNSNQCEGNK